MSFKSVAFVLLVAGSAAVADTSLTKKPDLGNYWWPLGNNGNTPVYADSFVAPDVDTDVQRIGMWLDDVGSGGTNLRFEIWGNSGGPNPFDVISSTGTVSPLAGAGLNYNEYATNGGTLVPGNTYWFVATAVGEAGSGFWQTGGHTQNSDGIVDNGTFWYSNDPNGINFDGQNLTPEMAFSVSLGRVPAPGSAALLGLSGLMASRRRRA